VQIFPAHVYPQVSFLVCLAILLGACGRVEQPWTEDYDRSSMPVSESWEVSFRVSETDPGADGSRPRLVMEAAYMATFEDDSTYTHLEGGFRASDRVRATIFDKQSGDTSAIVLADRITYNDRDRRFDATGDVFVEATGERTLNSERFFWYERTRSVRAPGFVRIVTPRERIEGYNLDADEDLDNYRLERVTGEAQIETDEAGEVFPSSGVSPNAPLVPEADTE
jgi:hypothetical protein